MDNPKLIEKIADDLDHLAGSLNQYAAYLRQSSRALRGEDRDEVTEEKEDRG